jgi:hypothetical protein
MAVSRRLRVRPLPLSAKRPVCLRLTTAGIHRSAMMNRCVGGGSVDDRRRHPAADRMNHPSAVDRTVWRFTQSTATGDICLAPFLPQPGAMASRPTGHRVVARPRPRPRSTPDIAGDRRRPRSNRRRRRSPFAPAGLRDISMPRTSAPAAATLATCHKDCADPRAMNPPFMPPVSHRQPPRAS